MMMISSYDVLSYLLQVAKLLIALLFLHICKIFFQWRFSPLRHLPGPRTGRFFLFGEFFTIFNEPFFAPHMRWWRECNYAPLMSYTSLFGRWVVIPTDPKIIKHVLASNPVSEPVRYYKDFTFFRDMVGDGLVSLEGKTWSRHRRILQPCFQTGLVKETLTAAVPAKVKNLIESWQKSEGREIDVYAHMTAITLDVLGEVSFAHDFNALDTITNWANDNTNPNAEVGKIQDPMMKALALCFKPSVSTIVLGMLKMRWLQVFNRKRNNTRRLLDEAAENIIKSATENNTSEGNNKQLSLIHVLLAAIAKDKSHGGDRNSLSMQELKDELKMMIVAGHETTSTWLYWAFYALGKHPDVQDKVLQDIQKHTTATPNENEELIGLESVEKMEYFLAFLNECLRLYSPAGFVFRYLSGTENWNGTVIPKKTRIIIPIFLLHRHPDVWNEPEKFMPERWLPNATDTQKRHPFCFLPFSAGGRNCIGERFARIEAQLILVNLIRKFHIKLTPDIQNAALEFRSSLTVKSKPRVQIVVKSR